MPFVLCPSCHRSMLASEFLDCEDENCMHFIQCPACDACIPLAVPVTEHEVLPELEAA